MPTNREIFFSLLKENNKHLPRLVIKSLLNDANGFHDDVSLYKNFDLQCQNYEELESRLKRIKDGEPYQYVMGYANFIDHEFKVNPDVLIPRQETEQLTIETKGYIELMYPQKDIVIADICTGSGAIAVTMKRFFPTAKVLATDISEKALNIAKQNARDNGVDVKFYQGDLLEPLLKENKKIDVLICNPPYIEKEEEIDEQVWKYEPHLALLAKPSTMFYQRIFASLSPLLNQVGFLAFEIGEDMNDSLADLVEEYFPGCVYKIAKDMYGKFRFLYIIYKEGTSHA